jgi:hypothetical protein
MAITGPVILVTSSSVSVRRDRMTAEDSMRYLCLIYMNEQELDAMPAAEMSALNAAHWDFNDNLRASGQFIQAEALEPARATACVRVRQGKTRVTDGPFTESKEMIAGSYVIEARDMSEATEIASRIPSAPLATIEVRPARQLIVQGRESRWG